MSLNIPVNLMSTVAPNSQPSVSAEAGATAVGPIASTSASAGKDDPSSGGGADLGRGGGGQQMLMSKLRTTLTTLQSLDRAEPKSVVTAQTAPPQKQSPDRPEQAQEGAGRPSELDRYAPPDPLPTAPILLAASAYAARRAQD